MLGSLSITKTYILQVYMSNRVVNAPFPISQRTHYSEACREKIVNIYAKARHGIEIVFLTTMLEQWKPVHNNNQCLRFCND